MHDAGHNLLGNQVRHANHGMASPMSGDVKSIEFFFVSSKRCIPMRRRRKFTTSIQPAKAYEDESVIMSGPH